MKRKEIWLTIVLPLLECCSMSAYEWHAWLERASQTKLATAKCAFLLLKAASEVLP
jgi:hypothetical protein